MERMPLKENNYNFWYHESGSSVGYLMRDYNVLICFWIR